MMWPHVIALLLGATGAEAALPAEKPKELYTAEILILKTPETTPSIQSAGFVRSEGSSVLITGPVTLRWGGETLSSDGSSLRLNGKVLSAGDTGSSIAVQAAPRVTSVAGEKAEILFGGGPPVQYMEKEVDGRFRLRLLDKSPMIRFELVVNRGSAPGLLQMELGYHVVTMGSRIPIPNVSLEVGAPTITELNGTRRIEMKAEEWGYLAFEGDGPRGLVLLFKIRKGE